MRYAALLFWIVLAAGVAADGSWLSVSDWQGGRSCCLQSDGERFDYVALGTGDEVRTQVTGPRRLKIISRYLFATDDPDRVPYTLVVHVDGRQTLRKRFTGRPHEDVAHCAGEGRVASLRRGYIELPAGDHEVAVTVVHEGGGEVALRLFRMVKRVRDRWMTLAPESYESVRHLEFESGSRSTYYHFDDQTPLQFEVSGPTTLRLRTRLDFDHRMQGHQSYTLAVRLDGTEHNTFHYDTTELSSAVWLEAPDILPGARRELRIDIPRGQHQVVIRCVRPETCGVAAMAHIPSRDLVP